MSIVEDWRKKAPHSKQSYKKKLLKISRIPDKKLDKMADQAHTETFNKLDCLECGNCCKNIPALVGKSDIKPIAKFLGMSPKAFEAEYTRIDSDGDIVLKTSPCVFLDDNNYCQIYEVRPRGCREFPHTDAYDFRKNMKRHALNATFCPAVAHVIEKLEKMK